MKGGVVAAVIIVAAAVWMVSHVSSLGPAQTSESDGGTPFPRVERAMSLRSAGECKACHPQVWDEWYASHHRMSYTNPMVQTQSKGFTDRDCIPCHLPRPIFDTGFELLPLERDQRYEDGIDCLSCHFFSEGNTCIGAGPLSDAAEKAPCNPSVHESVRNGQLCRPCHNQHKVQDDWKQTRFAVPGENARNCQDCHMPPVDRPQGRKGRSHRFPGAHDAAMVKSGVRLLVEKVGPGHQLLIEVRNEGTGHNFPADERHRAVDLHISVDSETASADARIDRYRNPYRGEFHIKNPLRKPGAQRSYEVSLGTLGTAKVEATRVAAKFNPIRSIAYPESTQIPAGEARSYRVRLPESIRRARLRLWFRKKPWEPDHEAILIYESDIDF